MKTLFGAVAGALVLGAVLVSYDLGERQTFSRDGAAMPVGYQQVGQPYVVQAGYVSPYAPYAAQYPYGVMAPAGAYPVPATQMINERYASQPVVRRVSTERAYATEQVAAKPKRTWQKSALLIGGSAAGGAGVGALIGGKKGAGIGALIGGGSAAIYDQVKRH